MSRIHEALKKAQEERHSSQAADTVTLSVETPRTQVIEGIGLGARAANAWARTETVPAPPRSAPMRKGGGTTEEGTEHMQRLFAPVAVVDRRAVVIHAWDKQSELNNVGRKVSTQV